jgi:predicted enzyme related to lactoylglutathione lyase
MIMFKALGEVVDGKEVLVEPVPNYGREPALSCDAHLQVPDPDALAAEFASRGVPFSVPIGDTDDNLRGFVIKDLDGYGLFFGRLRSQATEVEKKPATRTYIAQPVPELPVADVERAQQHYRDVLGFKITWLYPDKSIGAVARPPDVGIFFRKRTPPFEAAVNWVFAPDIDATYQELQSSGANIVDPLGKKPWGLWQFTVKDSDGNIFYFHHD